MIARMAMAILHRAIGKRVRVKFVEYGRLKTEKGFLGSVENRSHVELKGGLSIPFVGHDVAIIEIVTVRDGKVLYHNPVISASYRMRDLERVRELTWGTKKK